MKTIVKLAVLGAILYAALIYGRPWLEELLGDMGLGDVGGGGNVGLACVEAAERVNEDFADAIRNHGLPPLDLDRWSGALKMTDGRLQKARIRCQCEGDACKVANQALDALEQLMSSTDQGLRSGNPPFNSARDREKIVDLLSAARYAARR